MFEHQILHLPTINWDHVWIEFKAIERMLYFRQDLFLLFFPGCILFYSGWGPVWVLTNFMRGEMMWSLGRPGREAFLPGGWCLWVYSTCQCVAGVSRHTEARGIAQGLYPETEPLHSRHSSLISFLATRKKSIFLNEKNFNMKQNYDMEENWTTMSP